MGEPERLYTRKEACVRLHCGMSTLEKLIKHGELPIVRLGKKILIRERAIQAWIDAHERRETC